MSISKHPPVSNTPVGPIPKAAPMASPLAAKPMPVVQSKDNKNVKSSSP